MAIDAARVVMRREKVKVNVSLNDLIHDEFRQTSKKKVLLSMQKDYDKLRKTRLATINEGRKGTHRQKMRFDTVSNIDYMITISETFADAMKKRDLLKFFEDCLDVMQSDVSKYGSPDVAVVNFEGELPYMRVLVDGYDYDLCESRVKAIFGSRMQMRIDQSSFVRALKAKGYPVERDISYLQQRDEEIKRLKQKEDEMNDRIEQFQSRIDVLEDELAVYRERFGPLV